MLFDDRVDAGSRLAARLTHLQGEDVAVLGLPRGGVPVAFQVAQALRAPLDVIAVRKLGVPSQPELAMGAIGEEGARVVDARTVRAARVGERAFAAVEDRERAELQRRVDRFRGGRPAVRLAGRTVVVVDDGVATGATARAACLVARARGAARVVLAVPVAPIGWAHRLRDAADELVCVVTPRHFDGIGRWYRDFSPTSDEEVIACLESAAARPDTPPPDPPDDPPVRTTEVVADYGVTQVAGALAVPDGATGIVVFAHGSGSGRHSPRNQLVAAALHRENLGTLMLDLLAPDEEHSHTLVYDVALLAGRLSDATRWLRLRPEASEVRIGYLGAGASAAAALWAAGERGSEIAAVVSCGGRPDLAVARLGAVRASTLLIVGGRDRGILDLNRRATRQLRCPHRLAVVPGATHAFAEPGTLDAAAGLAADWFTRYLRATRRPKAGPAVTARARGPGRPMP